MGTEKHSIASKNRWANVPAEERSRRMSELAKRKHAKLSPEQRKAESRRLLKAKKNKTK